MDWLTTRTALFGAVMGTLALGCGSDVNLVDGDGSSDAGAVDGGALGRDGGSVNDSDGGGAGDGGATDDGGTGLDAGADDGGEVCVALAESCNGEDDDCDGAIDEDGDATCAFALGAGACEDGVCVLESCDEGAADCDDDPTNGCEALGDFYADTDDDGFGDAAEATFACEAPGGTVTNDEDCFDDNGAARPTQTEFFALHRGDGSWDYDCDETEEKQWTDLAVCELGPGGCRYEPGWFGVDSIPACGAFGAYLGGCRLVGGECVPYASERQQRCR